jgi:hypothetical protein
MKQNYLPRGYYVVLPPSENTEDITFTYGSETYVLHKGIDAFFDIGTAQQNAVEKPDIVLSGLPYNKFDSPVLLFAAGEHKIDKHIFNRSLVLLGAAAGIPPDIYGNNSLTSPIANDNRNVEESVLVGSFWFGDMYVTDSPDEDKPINSITFDGFTLHAARIIVNVAKSTDFKLTLSNLIYKGPCGNTLITASKLSAEDLCTRNIILDEIRIRDYDGYDYGGSFIRPCAQNVSIHHVCFSGTDKPFGFSDFPRSYNNSPDNSKLIAEISVSDCYFENLNVNGGISLASGSPVKLSFTGS